MNRLSSCQIFGGWRLPLAVLPVGFGQTAFTALVPLMVAAGGVSAADIGVAAMVGTIAFVLAAPAWSGLSGGRDARERLWLFAVLMAAAHLVLLGAVAGPVLTGGLALAALLASRALYGIAAAGLAPTAQAVVVAATGPADRAGGLARLGAGLSAGRILGSLVALAAPLGAAVPFVLLALSPLASLAAPKGLRIEGGERPVRLSPFDRRLAPFLAAAAAMTGCIGMMQIVLGLLMQTRFALDAASAAALAGALFAALSIVMIAVQLGIAHRRLPAKAMTVTGLALIGAGAGAVALPLAMPVLMLGVALAGVGAAIAAPFAAAWASSRLAPAEQRAATGWLATVQVAGQGTGAAIGAVLFASWPPLPFVASAGVALCAALAVATLRDTSR